MVRKFDNFELAKSAAMANPGSVLGRDPNGKGWIVKGLPEQIQGTSGNPSRKSKSAVSTRKKKRPYAKKVKPKSVVSAKTKERSEKDIKKALLLQKNPGRDPKYIIPEEYRRKIDEGFKGSREATKRSRRFWR